MGARAEEGAWIPCGLAAGLCTLVGGPSSRQGLGALPGIGSRAYKLQALFCGSVGPAQVAVGQ